LLADADGYVDRKLAQFEVVLGQLASQVSNGRLRLATRAETERGGAGQREDEAAHGATRHDDEQPEAAPGSDIGPDQEVFDPQRPTSAEVPMPAR
jgi:hypothetical protein